MNLNKALLELTYFHEDMYYYHACGVLGTLLLNDGVLNSFR